MDNEYKGNMYESKERITICGADFSPCPSNISACVTNLGGCITDIKCLWCKC